LNPHSKNSEQVNLQARESLPIIVVDDDPDDQYILGIVFERIGITQGVKYFSSGQDVIDYLRATAQCPFLILCDVNMPNMSGFELRKTLVEDEALKKKSIPFVFYSTAATRREVEKAFELTVQGFFEKGLVMEECERKMRIVIDYWKESKRPDAC
jgi:CheY-like chemotaxis protein